MIIIPIALLLLVAYIVVFYNGLKTIQIQITAAIQEIGNQLKRQSQLIPNLIESTKGYLKHEKDILTMLSDARKMVNQAVKTGDVARQTAAAGMLGDIMPRLSVIVESNPQLQGNTTVTNLMEELRDTADKVMYARRTLIDLSADYNIRIVTFPSNLVAGMFRFKEQIGLKVADMESATSVSASETKSPKISL